MKIRIYDNSVRLRLDRAEVDRVAADNPVSGTTHFPDGAQFTYALNTHKGEALQACFAQGCIELKVPRSVAQNWANDESEVSIRGSLATSHGALSLLIEKDFECLEPRSGEDQSNRFRNPKAALN